MARCGHPWQDSNLQPPVPETGALSVALQGHLGDRRELNPSIVESQSTVLPLHHDRQALCGGGGTRTPSRVLPRRLVSTELQYRSATPPESITSRAVMTGLEPASSRSTGGCSHRLSYTTKKLLNLRLSREELNLRPPLYQSGALNQLSYRTPAPRAGLEPAPPP